ncbi:hypothetical protein [Sinorhizobium glycinis]|nr:hypothetical protein [Sinorhizobium glycinis]
MDQSFEKRWPGLLLSGELKGLAGQVSESDEDGHAIALFRPHKKHD